MAALLCVLLIGCASIQARDMGVELSAIESAEIELASYEAAYLQFRDAGGDLNADRARELQLAFGTAHSSIVNARLLEANGATDDRVLMALQGAMVALQAASTIIGGIQ